MKKVLNKRSNETQGGGAKAPSASNLEYGEIAVNYHDGVEKLFIKNDSNKVKTIRTDNQLPPVEKHEGQEFVYRQAVNENEAQSLRFDRIYGKTLAWNSLVQNGNFATGSAWIVTGGATMSIESNIATIDLSSPSAGVIGVYQEISMTKNHIYYVAFDVKFSTDNFTADPSFYIASTGLYGLPGAFSLSPDKSTNWKTYSAISRPIGANGDFANGFGLRLYNAINNTVPSNFQLRNTLLIDLTLMFGAGNEPSTIAEFEAMFPKPYYPYNEGTLISNNASSIETIGFNVMNENFDRYDSTHPFLTRYIEVLPNTNYYLRYPTDKGAGLLWYYDINKTVIKSDNPAINNQIFITPARTRYIRLLVPEAYGVSYNHDICINISDPLKNGTYEPYQKNKMHLNLDKIEVKSHNIWDEEWEVGRYDPTSGEKDDSTAEIRCKNFIPVFGNTVYYFYNGGLNHPAIFYYDTNHNFISLTYHTSNTTLTTPANCAYICFYMGSQYGTTYNHDICINVSSSFNGQYEPYGDNGILTIEGGLKGAGSAKDEIIGNKYIKRIETVDLGTLNWSFYYQQSYAHTFRSGGISDSVKHSVVYEIPNAVSQRYAIQQTVGGEGDPMSLRVDVDGAINIRDDSYSTTSDFKTGLSGVYLGYELTTPIEYELVNPIHPVVKSGTIESRISPNPDGLSAPMVADISYTQTSEYILGELDSKLGDIESILETI